MLSRFARRITSLVAIAVGDGCLVGELARPTEARSIVVLAQTHTGDGDLGRARRAAATFQDHGYATLVVRLTTTADTSPAEAELLDDRVNNVIAWTKTNAETANLTIAVVVDGKSEGRIIAAV